MPIESVDIQRQEVLEKILARATEILTREYGASHVVFHGSRFHGDPYPDSDIDLLVVKETDQAPMERTKEAEALLEKVESPVDFDVQVWTPKEVRQGLSEGQTYVGMALINGKILHGKEMDLMTPREYFYNVKSWLDEARRHLQHMELDFRSDYDIGAMDELFQATERYMKAFLMTKGVKVEIMHSLPGLLDQMVKHEPSWESFRKTLEIAYEWGRACHYPPRQEGEIRIVPTLAEVKELYGKLDPWLKTLDRSLEKVIKEREKSRKNDHGLGF